jgi:hypothetical protein
MTIHSFVLNEMHTFASYLLKGTTFSPCDAYTQAKKYLILKGYDEEVVVKQFTQVEAAFGRGWTEQRNTNTCSA